MAVVSLNRERKPMWKRRLALLSPFLAALFLFTFSLTGTFAQGATASQASNFDTVGAGWVGRFGWNRCRLGYLWIYLVGSGSDGRKA